MRKIKSLFGFFKKNEPKRTANLKKNAKVVNASPDTKMRDVERKKETLEAVCDEMTVEVKDVPSEKQLKNEVESNVQPEAATNDEGLKAQIYNLIIVDESG